MTKRKRLSNSTIGTPIYHRIRRNWMDDRDLIEELASNVYKLGGTMNITIEMFLHLGEKSNSSELPI